MTHSFPQREPLTQPCARLAPATPLAAHVLTALMVVTAAAPFSMSGPVIFGLSSLSLFYVLLSSRVRLPHWTILAFVGWCAMTVSWSVAPAESLKGVLNLVVSSLAVWCLVHQLERAAVLRVLANAMKLLLLGSLLVYLALPVSGREQTDDHFGALRGVFSQRNAAAFVITAGLLLFVYLAASPSFGHRKRSAAWALFALVMLLATESSTGLAVGVVSCALLLFLVRLRAWGRSVRQLFAVLLLSVTSVAVVGTLHDLSWVSRLLGRDTTLTGRTFIWGLVKPYIHAEPWKGYGWAAVWAPDSPMAQAMWAVAHFQIAHAHDAYLDALVQTGAVGLVLLLLVCLTVLTIAGRRMATGSGDIWAVWPFAVTFFLLLYGVTEISFMSDFGWDLLVVALGLLVASRGATSGDDGRGAEPLIASSLTRPAPVRPGAVV